RTLESFADASDCELCGSQHHRSLPGVPITVARSADRILRQGGKMLARAAQNSMPLVSPFPLCSLDLGICLSFFLLSGIPFCRERDRLATSSEKFRGDAFTVQFR